MMRAESTGPESHAVVNGNGSSGDLEVVKQEILREMRKEINKAKQEIIDGEGSSKRTLFFHTLHSQYFFFSVIRLELSRR
jgi:hypothetical protein